MVNKFDYWRLAIGKVDLKFWFYIIETEKDLYSRSSNDRLIRSLC